MGPRRSYGWFLIFAHSAAGCAWLFAETGNGAALAAAVLLALSVIWEATA